MVRTWGRRRCDLPSSSWGSSHGDNHALHNIPIHPVVGWGGSQLHEEILLGLAQPRATAFIGREAEGEGEGWIRLIKRGGTDCTSPPTKLGSCWPCSCTQGWREVQLSCDPPQVPKVKQHLERECEMFSPSTSFLGPPGVFSQWL